ncbi:hypothetical protein MAMC_01189 [Methylacidimicrobium cyclopophantes]|uniref:Peptidase A2 domain-containing protein n=1 Tax=Methylacidimicrobium cyclopophantes TaxID=1041766 RepID=A0A5E6MCM6_9BACT|nr:aspartyl protease family protein [Methylacidimicrobium cyclopophantes]VVM06680.1 hypothetical protein MAMC_01189 [Methylacidimicrobium cyclopophantes]
MSLCSGIFLLLLFLPAAAAPARSGNGDAGPAQVRCYLAQGNFEEAARRAQKEVLLHPEKGESWRLLGAIALQQGKMEQAEQALERALRVGDPDPEAASLLAVLWRREGRFPDAVGLLRRLGGEAEAEQLAAFGSEPPLSVHGPDQVRLAWVGSGARPIVRVLVAGKRRADFLIDTGASCVVLDRQLAEEIRLLPLGAAQLLGAGGRKTNGKLARLDSLRLGTTEVRNIPVAIVNLPRPERASESFEGILGSEFLRRFVVTLDYPKRSLFLQRAGTERSAEGASTSVDRGSADLPLRLTPGGLVVVPLGVASGEKLLVFLDTGAAETVLALSRRAAIQLGVSLPKRADRYSGVGGRYLALPILLPEVRLAGFSVHNVAGIIAPFPSRIEEGEGLPLGGYVGSGFCRLFRVTLDFPRMRLRLTLAENET